MLHAWMGWGCQDLLTGACLLQAANPKDQYLLLKALNEVIVSLTSDMGNKQLSPSHQQEVCAPHSADSSCVLAPTGCCHMWEIRNSMAFSMADSSACGAGAAATAGKL